MRGKWWRAYFFVALTLTVVGLALLFSGANAETAWWEWIPVPLYVVQMVGLFGFVFCRRVAVPPVWQGVFIASIAYEAWDLFSTAMNPELAGSGYAGLVAMVVAVTLVLQLPMLAALFLYGFRCRTLWHGATEARC